MLDRVVFFKDNRSPQIVRRLSYQRGDFDVTNQEFRLRVRDLWGDAVLLDKPMSSDPASDQLFYVPQAGDFANEGLYRAWVFVDFGDGITQDTDEFEIAVYAHAPGQGTRVGAIWRACRGLAPVAWDSLRGHPDYGDIELQRIIELAKLRVLGSPVPAAQEDSIDPRVTDYIAKKVLVDNGLPAVIDFWTNQVVAQTALGNSNEVKTYPDRIRAVQDLIDRYAAALDAQSGEIATIVGGVASTTRAPVLLDGGRPITPGLDELPRTMRPPRMPLYYDAEHWVP